MTRTLSHGSASLTLHKRGEEGRIDAFAAGTEAEGSDLIAQAAEILKDMGCVRALGPIGLDTWGPYRVVTESDGSPEFPGEPATPLFYARCFAANGFAAVETYRSTVDQDPAMPSRQTPSDIDISEWDRTNPAKDMEAIHALSNSAFAGAPYFSPIGIERFTAINGPLLASIPSRHALLARDGTGEIVACLLGYPAAGGLVLKSLMSKKPGAGSALVDEFYRRAIADGYRAIIHALMHEDNRSTRMSQNRNGRVFRRYALFGRAL